MTKKGSKGLSLEKKEQIRKHFLAKESAFHTSQKTKISYRTVKKYYDIFAPQITKTSDESSTYPLSNKKPTEEKQKPIYHAVGVIPTEQEAPKPTAYHDGVYQKFPPELIRNHVPQYNVVPFSNGQTPKPLSAAQISQRRQKNKTFFPKFFMNPYQDLDYMVLQDIYANSIAGRIIDRLIEMLFGNGIKPVLKLRNPKDAGDEKLQQKEIENNQKIIDDLIAVDEALGDPDDEIDPYLDTDINTKFLALVKNAFVFGRSMIIKEFLKPVKLADGRVIAGIPNVLKVIHSRDMGLIEIDQESWKLKSVNVRFTGQQVVPQQMIYIEHGSDNPVYNALHYGYSAMQSMIGASRSLKQMIEVDFPTISKHVWAGIGFMFIKPEGTTPAQKQAELDQINSIARAGRLNSLMLNPEDVKVDFQDFNPKINELVQLADFLIRYNIAQTGMPQAIFAQEKDSNRATLIGKIRFFMDSVVRNHQKWICQEFAKQWYMPNFKAIYGKDSEIFKKFKIDCEFEPLKIEAFDDAADAVIKINKEFPLSDKAAGDLLGIENFEAMRDPDIQKPDPNKRGFGFVDKNGDDVEMEKK